MNQSPCEMMELWLCFSCFQGSCGSFKTDMVLECPWICVWRSLKVLELDLLKRRDRTTDCYHQIRFLGSNAT